MRFLKSLRRPKTLIALGTTCVALVVLFALTINIIVPFWLLTTTATIYTDLDLQIFEDSESMNTYYPSLIPGGQAYQLTGGLTAMGINFDKTIAELQMQYAAETDKIKQDEIVGKIIYAQLFQILDVTAESLNHPLMLLGVAMAIRETSTFSSSYTGFVDKKVRGPEPVNGIYGTWCNSTLNGVAGNGGGVTKHETDSVAKLPSGVSKSSLVYFDFYDYATGTTKRLALGSQTYDSLYHTSTTATDYNHGAYGPLQIEADHWITYAYPIISTDTKRKGYKANLYGTAAMNIPIDETKYDKYFSAQQSNFEGMARSIVTYNNHHLVVYRNNKEVTDNIMATIGHADYLQNYINIANSPSGQKLFAPSTGYYFANRFKTPGKEWDDFVMSLESWVQAYTLMCIDRTSLYCFFDNTANIKNSNGNVVTPSFDKKVRKNFGDDFMDSLVNDTAKKIYWTLEMLQSWNYGNVNADYSEPSLNYAAYVYHEIANYIAQFGTDELHKSGLCVADDICSCGGRVSDFTSGDKSTCSGKSNGYYRNMMNFICEANNTPKEYRDKIMSFLADASSNTSSHKNNYGYAVSAIFQAEYYAEQRIREIFGIENFNIFNYGAINGSAQMGNNVVQEGTQPTPTDTPIIGDVSSTVPEIGTSTETTTPSTKNY